MTKTLAFIITTVLLLGSLNTFAVEAGPHSRGLIIALDTRDRRSCEVAQKTVAGLTTSDASQICAQDGRNPYAVIIITVPVPEFEYLSEVAPPLSSRPQLAVITNPQLGTMFILPKSKDTDQYFRIMARRNKASITVFRLEDFGDMSTRYDRSLKFSFLLKSNSTESTSKKIAASVAKHLVFNRSSLDMNNSQYRSQAMKAASIMDTVNDAIQDTINTDRASIDFFMPSKKCTEPHYCPKDRGYSLGIKVFIRF